MLPTILNNEQRRPKVGLKVFIEDGAITINYIKDLFFLTAAFISKIVFAFRSFKLSYSRRIYVDLAQGNASNAPSKYSELARDPWSPTCQT